MWKTIAFTLILLLMGPAAMAATPDLPSIFTPVPNDLSLWYLGNIFGSDLIPGQNVPNQMLLSQLFGIFNQVVLAVGLAITVYAILIGTLNTAGEGKAMGEKLHSLWIPIRMMSGIGMLIPKAGSGYCMAQYIVIWMTIQGIGAADSVWNTMLDYFKSGGSIYTTHAAATPTTNFTYSNMDYVYSLMSTNKVKDSQQSASILHSMVCMDKFNAMTDVERDGVRYAAYVPPDHPNLLVFGNKKQYEYPASEKLDQMTGAECGIIKLGKINGENKNLYEKTQHERLVERTYITGVQSMMNGLKYVSQAIAANKVDTRWELFYPQTLSSMDVYINYIVSYSKSLVPPKTTTVSQAGILETFKEFGWMLAGNYYTLLSHQGDKAVPTAGTFILPGAAGIDSKFEYIPPKNANSNDDKETVENIKHYFDRFMEDPKAMYNIKGSEWQQEQAKKAASYQASASSGSVHSPLTQDKMSKIQEAVGSSNSNPVTGLTKIEVDSFIKLLSGEQNGGFVSQDPILSAAKHGKHLTEAAMTLMISFSVAWTTGMLLAATMSSMQGGGYTMQTILDIFGPMIIALGAFMYGEGVMLGVFIPIIPYLTFLTGVIGWFLSVVEAVAAAPLVAIGLILPESKEDIWGRAAPAYMLTLNLFLRPALMIVGFAAAMIVTWVLVEILNIGFLTLVAGTFRIENLFGFVTIMMAYTAIFTYVVTEAYSLINVVPNKVFHWIGDQSQGVKGPEEAIGAAKAGGEAGGRAVAAGAGSLQTKADMYRATSHAKQAMPRTPPPTTAGGSGSGEKKT
ncbi:MAG: DotA/TraY family protein [Gammaproteobacteria bacterium]